MQFKNIGEIAKVLKNVGTDSNSLASNLGDIGIEAAKAALEINNVSEKVQRATLVQKYGKEVTDAIMGVGNAATISTSKVKNLGNAFVGAGKSAKDLFIGTITAHPIITAVTAIVAAFALMSTVAVDAKEKVENAVTSAEKYQQTKTEIQSISSELDTIGSQIDQLNAKENLSLTDAQELSRLQAQSAELERQLEIKKGLAEIEQQQAARDAKKAFNAFSLRNSIDTNGEGLWTNIADGMASAMAWVFDKTGLSEPLIGKSKSFGNITLESTTDTPDKILSDRIFAAKSAQKKLKELQDKQTIENYDSIQSQIDTQQKIVDNYATNLQDLYSEIESYTSSFYDDSTGEVLSGFENEAKRWETVQNEYLDYFGKSASSKEGAINTLFSKKQFSGLENGFIEAAQTGSYAIRQLIDETPGISEALDEAGVSVDEFVRHFMALGNPNALKLETVKNQLQTAYSDILGDNPTLEDLRKSDYRGLEMKKLLDGKSDEEITLFYKYVNDGDIDLSELTLEDIEEIFIKINADTTPAEMSLEELTQSANDVVSSINSINSMLSSQGTGKSISSEIFSNEELKDYQSALEYVNGCYQLNTEKVKELTEAKVDEAIATNNTKKAIEQQNYLKNAKEIDSLRKKIEENNFAQGESAESIQLHIDNLLEQNSAIISNCNQLDVLNASLRESIGVYQQWKDAQSAGNSGDMFDDAGTAWSQIRDIADKESDMYGRVGTVQYQAAVDFLVPEEIDHSDQKAVQKYLDGIKKYMYFDDNGDVNGLNIQRFLDDAVAKGLMEKDGENYVTLGKMSMQKFAEGMGEEGIGLTLPLVQAIFGEIEEFKPEGETWFEWDAGVQTLGDLAVAAKNASAELKATKEFANVPINLDISEIENDADKVAILRGTLDQVVNTKNTLDLDSSQIEQADTIIQYCMQHIQQLTAPAIMSVDTSMVEGQIGEVLSLFQEFQTASNVLETTQKLDLDTTEAQAGVDAVISKIKASNPEVLAKVGIAPDSEITSESITTAIGALDIEAIAKLIPDDEAIIGYTAEDKEANVIYSVVDDEVKAYNPPDIDRYLKYHITTVNDGDSPLTSGSSNKKKSSGKSGGGTLNGTAHAYGTALADGVWGAKQGGMALVGELGREIIVDPYTGRWHTVGDNGAEFTYVPKHALVFNHIQTEELLKNGYVASRAQALVSGNALASGNAYARTIGTDSVSATIPIKSVSASATRNNKQKTTEKKSTSKSTSNNTKAVNKNTSATNKNTEAIEESQDWISVRLDRISKQLDEYKTLASDYYQAFASQNKMLDAAINQSKSNIKANEQAYATYMMKANEVGLSEDYKNRIINGEVNIHDITDENLKNQIDDFTEFYEKALACRDTIIDLKTQIIELSKQKIDNVIDDYETFLSVADSVYGRFEAENKLFDAMGKSPLQDNLNAMIDARNAQVRYGRGELQELLNLEKNLLQSGDIKKWSQEWYDLRAKINDVTASIYEAEAEVYELRQQLREIRWEPFRKAIEDIDATNDNLENTLSLISDLEAFGKDSDALNINGKLQLGLLTKQLGNARQAVAEYENAFKALDNELANGNITQEQYDEQLKELNEGRWEAVSSVKKYRDAILSLVKEGINKKTEAMKKLMDARKKDLQAQKDAANYARTLRDKTAEINKIKAQIAALQGDDSATAKAQLRNLQNQLKEKEQDLQDTQDDHAFDVLQDGYDNAMEKFEEIQENELYLLNSSLEAQNEAIANMLMVARDNYQEIYDELNEIAEVYGMKLSEDVVNPWTTATEAVNAYKQAVGDVSSNTTIDTSPIAGTSNDVDYVRYAENNTSAPDNNITQQQQSSAVSGKVSEVPEVLQYGSQGNSVKLLQTALNGLGYNCGAVDGSFGDQTLAAVKRFQLDVGMAGDGVVGDNTKAQFRARGYATGSPSTKKGLAYYDEKGLGSEVIITDKGVLRQFNAGEIVFNAEQAKYLYDTSKYAVKNNFPTAQMPLHNPELLQRDYGVHFDNLLNVEGNLTEEVIPKVEKMINTAIKNFDKETRRQISNNYRKLGGRLYQW